MKKNILFFFLAPLILFGQNYQDVQVKEFYDAYLENPNTGPAYLRACILCVFTVNYNYFQQGCSLKNNITEIMYSKSP
jgi:hypothetical protein